MLGSSGMLDKLNFSAISMSLRLHDTNMHHKKIRVYLIFKLKWAFCLVIAVCLLLAESVGQIKAALQSGHPQPPPGPL